MGRIWDEETARQAIAQIGLGELGLLNFVLDLPYKCGHHAGGRDKSIWAGVGIFQRVLMGKGIRFAILWPGLVSEGELETATERCPAGLASIEAFGQLDVFHLVTK